MMSPHVAAAALAMSVSASACPTDVQPRAAGTVLTVQRTNQPAQTMDSVVLATLPQTTLTQRQTVASSGSGTTDRAVVYTGVLLPDLLLQTGFASATDRGAWTSIVEAVASDGYRAVFSWGELVNSAVGEQAVVITAQDGKALDAAAVRWRCARWPTCARGPGMCATCVRSSCAVLRAALPAFDPARGCLAGWIGTHDADLLRASPDATFSAAVDAGVRTAPGKANPALVRATVATGEVRTLPNEPATTRGFWRDQTKKSPNREWLGLMDWWNRGESNPRPQAITGRFYMRS